MPVETTESGYFLLDHSKKSLSFHINIRIVISAVLVLSIGGSIAIWQAKSAIRNEVDSSLSLALQLIQFAYTQPHTQFSRESDWLSGITEMEPVRHLNIQLKTSDGATVDLTSSAPESHQMDNSPPAWFINLVKGQHPHIEQEINTFDGKKLILTIQADPLDEINEVWQESRAYYLSILALTLFTFLAVNLVFKQSFKAISTTVGALKDIENGIYDHKLPAFAISEYDRIATAINHLTQVLADTQSQNRALTRHTMEIQEQERKRLAKELHDELGQSLTAIKLMAVTLIKPKQDIEHLSRNIVEISDHLMEVVRSMMQQLHPLILSELGLKAALEEMVNRCSERHTELNISMNCDDNIDQLNETITIQIFRVIQECLTNSLRHANAQRITISIQIDTSSDAKLSLLITDDGQGCDLQDINTGFGLSSMKERIQSIGGHFQIQSSRGTGMQIEAFIPLS